MANKIDQEIRFCTSKDGVRIAYAVVGSGPPLVKVANWLSHLEYDWNSPAWGHWIREHSRNHTLVRHDARGCGLSDWDIKEYSLNAWVDDLEAVVDALELKHFPLLGISQGGPIAIAYTNRHPEKVSHLILYGTYARGLLRRNLPSAEEEREVLLKLVRVGWGKEHSAFRQVFTSLFLPEGTPDQMNHFNELQRVSSTPENAARMIDVFHCLDVTELTSTLKTPTIVLHAKGDLRIPFEEGRLLASMIPGAKFVPLESRNHVLLELEPAWKKYLEQVRDFLGLPQMDFATTVATAFTSPASAVTSGQKIGNYDVLEKIGEGGMSVVFKARDLTLERTVALKLLLDSPGGSPQKRLRFLREAKSAAAMDHPNICTIYEINETSAGHPFISMAYYQGETLREKIDRYGQMPLTEILDYAIQTTKGLAHAHNFGVVHRDIKPGNIFVTSQGTVKILDFGIAKMAEENFTQSGMLLGTLAYMSPEQACGKQVDVRSDLFSLGVVMFEMFSGRPPFSGASQYALLSAIQNIEPPSLKNLRPDLPEPWTQLIAKLLEKDPANRHQSSEELLQALHDLLS
jgi:pimeloyl-ACP methyl ester carboxylesterase